LVQALSDPDDLTAMLAARALASLGSEAVEPLLEVLKEAPLTARIQAMRALSEIADQRAIPAMISALDDASTLLRYWAELGLERLGLNMVYLKPE
jgi:HEAT repeat protein